MRSKGGLHWLWRFVKVLSGKGWVFFGISLLVSCVISFLPSLAYTHTLSVFDLAILCFDLHAHPSIYHCHHYISIIADSSTLYSQSHPIRKLSLISSAFIVSAFSLLFNTSLPPLCITLIHFSISTPLMILTKYENVVPELVPERIEPY